MKLAIFCSTLIAVTSPLAAQTPAPAPAPAPAPVAARLNLDTPIEQIVADPAGKAALDASLPGISTHPAYEQFKTMSLRQVQPMSNGKLTDEGLAKAETALAAVK